MSIAQPPVVTNDIVGTTNAASRSREFKKQPVQVNMGVRKNANQFVLPHERGSQFRSAGGGRFGWHDKRNYPDQNRSWIINPIGQSLAHIDWYYNGQLFGLQAVGLNQSLHMALHSQGLNQLWRFIPFPGYPNQYLLESLQYPGYCATFGNNTIMLEPIAFLPTQQWWFESPVQVQPAPVLRSSAQQVVANPPLPAAQIDLVNTSRDAVVVVIGDLRDPRAAQEFQIPGGGSQRVEFERDAGSTVIENYEIYLSNGVWDRQQLSYQIPPIPLYDISVYEIFLQSIAIDRTGTSPNPIEDINYQPKSVGFFQVPAGDALPESGQIDVMSTAQRQQNPGGVRPLPSKLQPDSKSDTSNPLQEILDEIQSRRGSF